MEIRCHSAGLCCRRRAGANYIIPTTFFFFFFLMHVRLFVTCYLRCWQNNRDLYRAVVTTRGWVEAHDGRAGESAHSLILEGYYHIFTPPCLELRGSGRTAWLSLFFSSEPLRYFLSC